MSKKLISDIKKNDEKMIKMVKNKLVLNLIHPKWLTETANGIPLVASGIFSSQTIANDLKRKEN